ncbi:peptide chain release factor N(5)-glutamine methyltransferase [Bdellovibrionota bacterium]
MSWTILSLIQTTESYFKKHGIENPRLNAEELLAHALKKDRIFLYMEYDQPVSQAQLDNFRELVRKRANHTPLQHLLGVQQFRGVELSVGQGVFIPRPETETLIDYARELLDQMKSEEIHCLEVGTGSCAIPLSLAQENPRVQIDALEILASSYLYAEKNLGRYPDLAKRINLIQADFRNFTTEKSYDIVISNPPYIARGDIKNLPQEVREGDPVEALDGGEDGLEPLRALAIRAKDWLRSGGWVISELGDDQGEVAKEIFSTKDFTNVELKQDLTERIRFVVAKKV